MGLASRCPSRWGCAMNGATSIRSTRAALEAAQAHRLEEKALPAHAHSDWTMRMPDPDLEVRPSPQRRRQVAVADFAFYAAYDGNGSA